MFSEFKLQPKPEKVGDQQASVVIATATGQPPVKLYFDTSTGLLLRMTHYTDSALGLNPVQVDFGDYRDAGGVKTPYRWTIARPSGAFTIQVSEVQTNVPIDEKLFVKPAARLRQRRIDGVARSIGIGFATLHHANVVIAEF